MENRLDDVYLTKSITIHRKNMFRSEPFSLIQFGNIQKRVYKHFIKI
jgi:hypothetical protein